MAIRIVTRQMTVQYVAGAVCFDPLALWRQIADAVGEATNGEHAPIRAVGITGMAESGLLVDDLLGQFGLAVELFPPAILAGRGYWLGTLSTSGGVIEWLRGILNTEPLSYDELSILASQAQRTPTGILFFPYLLGSGAPEATLLGAAVAAGIGVGVYANVSEALDAIAQPARITIEPDAAKHAAYRALFERGYVTLKSAVHQFGQLSAGSSASTQKDR